ncbi:MAG TPA: DUF4402 domain-containing protein [Sphingomicrobium sp.]|nr:DUF4402 domain-containing protein [Sphingomicrobium sp.]
MFGAASLRSLAAAALLVAAPSQLLAAIPATNSTGEVMVLRPLSLINVRDLDFGALIASATAGTATVDPLTGAAATAGGVTATPAPTSAARFAGARSLRGPVQIRIPTAPVTITRSGGTETMIVSDWTLDGHTTRQVGINEAFEFNVGGTLYVGANQAPGTYVGTFTVTVNYP